MTHCLGWLEGVVGREVYVEEKYTTLKRGFWGTWKNIYLIQLICNIHFLSFINVFLWSSVVMLVFSLLEKRHRYVSVCSWFMIHIFMFMFQWGNVPRMVACQWKGSSPTGPAEHWAGGSLAMSFNSLLIRFRAILNVCKDSETKSFYLILIQTFIFYVS